MLLAGIQKRLYYYNSGQQQTILVLVLTRLGSTYYYGSRDIAGSWIGVFAYLLLTTCRIWQERFNYETVLLVKFFTQ